MLKLISNAGQSQVIGRRNYAYKCISIVKYRSQNWTKDTSLVNVISKCPRDVIDYWSDRSCGLACTRMAIEYFTGKSISTAAIFLEAMRLQSYTEKGWIHYKLADICRNFGVLASAVRTSEIDLIQSFSEGNLIIASVRLRFPVDGGRGGHLILLRGAVEQQGKRYIMFSDPSRWGQTHGCISEARFLGNLSDRCILVHSEASMHRRGHKSQA